MINGSEIIKLLNINRQQLNYLVFNDFIIPKIKRNSVLSDLFDEKDIEILTNNKRKFRNNLLALEIENEWR